MDKMDADTTILLQPPPPPRDQQQQQQQQQPPPRHIDFDPDQPDARMLGDAYMYTTLPVGAARPSPSSAAAAAAAAAAIESPTYTQLENAAAAFNKPILPLSLPSSSSTPSSLSSPYMSQYSPASLTLKSDADPAGAIYTIKNQR